MESPPPSRPCVVLCFTSGASNDARERSVGNSTGPCEMPHREGTFRTRKPQHNSSSYLDRVSSVREEETLDLELFCQTCVPRDAHQEASCSLAASEATEEAISLHPEFLPKTFKAQG